MTSKRKLFSIVMLWPVLLFAQQGIRFEQSLKWNQVLQKAKQENKYIFVDCYATWCGPCKYMDKNIYPNDTIGFFFNEKFISVKVQMDTSASDNDTIKEWYADARKLKNQYRIGAFPTYLFFSPGGEVVHREAGAFGIKGFISIGKDALNRDKQYYTAIAKYHRGELPNTNVRDLALFVKRVEGMQLAHKIANDYINRVSLDSLFTKENVAFLYEFTSSSKDRGFKIFKDHAKQVFETNKMLTKERCKSVVLEIINKEEIKPYSLIKNGKPDWKKIKSNLKKYGSLGDQAFTFYQPEILFKSEIEPALRINSDWNKILPMIKKQNLGKNEEFVVGNTVIFYLNGIAVHHTQKNCKNLVAAASYYAKSFPTFLNSNALNDWAWVLFENSNEKDELMKALEWSKRSNEMEPGSPEFLDTYSNLLYKLGHVQEAIVWQEKAVDAAEAQAKERNSTPRPVFRENLGKMKKSEKTWLVPDEKKDKKE